MAKNAPKSVICPAIKATNVDCIDVAKNSSGNASVVTIKMLVGAPKTVSFTPEGKKEKVEFFTSGILDLRGFILDIDGVPHRFALNQKMGTLELRPTSSTAMSEDGQAVGF
jgi:hypothetical protein